MNTENMSVLQRMSQRAAQADQMVALLQAQIAQLKSNAAANACRAEEEKLKVENDKLRLEVEKLKRSLTNVEVENGVKQVALPKLKQVSSTLTTSSAPPTVPQASPVSQEQKKPIEEKKNKKAEKKEKKGGDNKGKQQAAPELPVDISRLDMRVGLIRTAKKHPDADGLYVEEVDVGEETPRTIISGLVKFVPLEQMQNRLAIFLLNLKPAKMRGIMSQGMIMCGSSPEVVEIIVPPPGSEIGDRVVVEGYDGSPDALLNPKKKIWEQVQPDLRINNDGLACYKGVAWNVAGKGTCSVPTMRDKIIK